MSSSDLASADRAFARFCRSGDADALAEVFDRTAPRLAVLAGHLVPGDAHAVEDLVQTTFVEAMRSARRFGAGRPVMPWLVAILGRRAANLRRTRSRRPEESATGAVAELAIDSLDPARLAGDRELAERVAAAAGELDAPYREVLVLRLVHALSPAEIARALGRPLGTVHAQLHRGAERLRRVLPPALAAALALGTGGRALAAVKERVLTMARDAVPAAPAGAGAGLLGGLLMTKVLIGIAALVALAVLLVLALEPPSAGTAPATTGGEDSMAAAARGESAEERRTNETPETARRAAVTAGQAEATVTLTGRVLAAETKAPLAGAEVEAMLQPRYFEQEMPDDVAAPAVVATGADGCYEIEAPCRGDLYLTAFVRFPGRATMVAEWLDLRPGAVVDSGDVPMPLGAELSLRVVDEEGEPVAAFELQLQQPPGEARSTDGRFRPWGWNGLQSTGLDGVAGPRSVVAGRWIVQYAEGTGHRYGGPSTIDVPAGRTEVRIDLPVRSPDPARAIAGVVVDEHGTPLVGVEVAARQPGMRGYRSVRSFGGGRFHVGGFSGPVTVFRVGGGYGERGHEYELLAPREPVPSGTRDLRIVVREVQRTSVAFRVVAATDRRPVERFRIGAVPVVQRETQTRPTGSMRLESSERHAGGVVRLEGLLPFDHVLTVLPDDPGLQPVLFHEFHALSSRDAPVEVALEPAVSWQVRVTDPQGAPVEGSTVELLRGFGRTRVDRDTPAYSSEDVFDRGIAASYLGIVTTHDTTGEDGVATLRSAEGVEGCALRVRGSRHVEGFVPLSGRVVKGEERTVVVQPAARLNGRLVPPELVAELGPDPAVRDAAAIYVDPESVLQYERIELALYEIRGDRRVHRGGVTVGDDGLFAFDALPGGDYVLSYRRADIAEVRGLEPGEERELEIDLRPHRPAKIAGFALLDGAPPEGNALLQVLDDTGQWRTFNLGEAGRFEGALRPGQYPRCRLTIRGAGGSGRDRVYSPAEPSPLLVEPGANLDVLLEFESRER